MAPSVSPEFYRARSAPVQLPSTSAGSLSHSALLFAIPNCIANKPLFLACLSTSFEKILHLQRRSFYNSIGKHSLDQRRSADAGNQRMVARPRTSWKQTVATAKISTNRREERQPQQARARRKGRKGTRAKDDISRRSLTAEGTQRKALKAEWRRRSSRPTGSNNT